MTSLAPRFSRRRFIASLGAALPAFAWAAYPDRPIRLICPFPPGSGSDFVARLIAARMQESLKQTILVENRTGAAGRVGIESVVRAAPDGYTFVYLSSAVTIQPWLTKVAYDVRKDLTPVSLAIKVPYVLVTHAGSKFSTFEDVLAAVRAGTPVTFASYGVGSPPHLIMEQLQSSLKIGFTHVPYGGGRPMQPDVLAGQVDLGWDLPVAVLQSVRAGKLRALAISSQHRAEYLPEAKPLGDIVPGLEMIGWAAVMAPAGVPSDVARVVQREVAAAVFHPNVVSKLNEQGYLPVGSTSEDLRKTIDRELESWGKLIRDRNIKVE